MICEFCGHDPDKNTGAHDCVGRRIMQERIRIVDALRAAGTRENGQGLCTEGLALLKAAEAIIDIKEDP
jgi:hypothetical protein